MDTRNQIGELKEAVHRSDLLAVKSLIAAGANVNPCTDEERNTLLHISSDLDIVNELLKHGASVHAQNTYRETPLDRFVYKNYSPALVEALLKKGASVNTVNRRGNTPLNILLRQVKFTSFVNYPLIELLLNYGADITEKNKMGFSPLDNAKHSKDVAELLIGMFSVYIVKNSSWDIHDYRRELAEIIDLEQYKNENEVYNRLQNILNNCVHEIIQMRNYKIFESISAFELLIQNDIIKITLHASIELIEKVKFDLKKRYRIYEESIINKIDRCFAVRRRLLSNLRDIQVFTVVSLPNEKQGIIVLDPYSTSKIGDSLSNLDLENLVEAFINLNIFKKDKNDSSKDSTTKVDELSQKLNSNPDNPVPDCCEQSSPNKRMRLP